MPEGEYELGGLSVYLKDKAVRLEDGTLAGSATNVYECMVNIIKMGIPECSAIKAATYNPAKSIGHSFRMWYYRGRKEGRNCSH